MVLVSLDDASAAALVSEAMGPAQLLALDVPPPPTKPAEPSVERQQERQERMAEEEDKKTGKDLHALLVPAGGGGGGGGVGGGRWFKVLLGAVLEQQQQQQQEKGLLAGQGAFAFVVVGPGLLVPRQLTAAEERDLELRKYASGDFYQYLCQSMPIPYGRAPHSCVLGNRCMYRFQARGCRRLHDGDPRWVPTRLIR